MSSRPSSRPGGSTDRQYQQDFITRIRYTNALPPPPGPPKLLDIPNNAAAEYTNTKFVSRLAREQPLNIEVDSELGMPLDLLAFGPHIFSEMDGRNASSILCTSDRIPKIDEKDKALLRSAAALGRPSKNVSGVSFLRRTEYISSESSRSTFKSTTSKDLVQHAARLAIRSKDDPKNDPINILKTILQGFETANPSNGQWKLPTHPTKKNLHAVESFPVFPNIEAHPDSNGYVIVKLSTNPVHPIPNRNISLDYALLTPWNDGGAPEDVKFDYFLPETNKDTEVIKRKYDEIDTSEDGYSRTDDGRGHVRFKRVRAYEFSANPTERANTYNEVILTLHDGKGGERPKGAYFSPISNRYNLRPMRPTKFVQPEAQREKTDVFEVQFREMNEAEEEQREVYTRELQAKPKLIDE